jgi:hypothetical protein
MREKNTLDARDKMRLTTRSMRELWRMVELFYSFIMVVSGVTQCQYLSKPANNIKVS